MSSFSKLIRIGLLSTLFISILDTTLCYRTYYIPDIKMFVSYKYTQFDDRATTNIQQKRKKNSSWLRFNFFGKSLLATRFARPYQPTIDWFVMSAPDEIGCAYTINKNKREINLSKNLFGLESVIDYNAKYLTVSNSPIPKDSLFLEDSASWAVHINEPYIVICNSFRITSSFDALPEKSMKKAHLWHLFLF